MQAAGAGEEVDGPRTPPMRSNSSRLGQIAGSFPGALSFVVQTGDSRLTLIVPVPKQEIFSYLLTEIRHPIIPILPGQSCAASVAE